jgi:hypothetical protein
MESYKRVFSRTEGPTTPLAILTAAAPRGSAMRIVHCSKWVVILGIILRIDEAKPHKAADE